MLKCGALLDTTSEKNIKMLKSSPHLALKECMPHLVITKAYKNLEIVLTKLNPQDKGDLTCLTKSFFQALDCGDPIALKMLLEAGAQCNALSPEGVTPLHYALGLKDPKCLSAECISLLLGAGAKVNARKSFEGSATNELAIHRASGEHGNTEIVRLLIKYRSRINAHTSDYSTPLTQALTWNNPEIAKELLLAGSDVYAISNGATPLQRLLEYIKIYAIADQTFHPGIGPIANYVYNEITTNSKAYHEDPICAHCLQQALENTHDLSNSRSELYMVALLLEHQVALIRKAGNEEERQHLIGLHETDIKKALAIAGNNNILLSIINTQEARITLIKEYESGFRKKDLKKFSVKHAANLGIKNLFCAFKPRSLACSSLSSSSLLPLLVSGPIEPGHKFGGPWPSRSTPATSSSLSSNQVQALLSCAAIRSNLVDSSGNSSSSSSSSSKTTRKRKELTSPHEDPELTAEKRSRTQQEEGNQEGKE